MLFRGVIIWLTKDDTITLLRMSKLFSNAKLAGENNYWKKTNHYTS